MTSHTTWLNVEENTKRKKGGTTYKVWIFFVFFKNNRSKLTGSINLTFYHLLMTQANTSHLSSEKPVDSFTFNTKMLAINILATL